MNELKTRAMVIRAINYRENDKLLTLFTLEHGKITACLRGCNKPNAKLKFAGQLFCLADFELVQTGTNYLVKTATEIENFFLLSYNYSRLTAGMSVLEILDATQNEQPNPRMLIYSLKALEAICYQVLDPRLVVVKFLLENFSSAGYGLNFDACASCGDKNATFLDLGSGSLMCGNCHTLDSLALTQREIATMKIVESSPPESLTGVKVSENVLQSILNALSLNFRARFGVELKSLKNF